MIAAITFCMALVLAPAFAGVPQDLSRAADSSLGEPERMVAFNQLVMGFENNRPQLEQVALSSKSDARQRWIAIRVMGQSSSRTAEATLTTLCSDKMPAVRSAAASALGDLGFKSATPTLAGLLEDPAVIVRSAAARSLGQLRDVQGTDALHAALSEKSNYYRGSSLWVRRHYVEALGDIGSRSSVPELIACFGDHDPEVVAASLSALRKIVGYDFAEGRTELEHMEAWRRWAASEGLER